MDIWVNMNKKNTFKNDFFWSNDSKEIWTTDIVTGKMIKNEFNDAFLNLQLFFPFESGFKYEECTGLM